MCPGLLLSIVLFNRLRFIDIHCYYQSYCKVLSSFRGGVWGAKNLRKAFVYPSLHETQSFWSSNLLGFLYAWVYRSVCHKKKEPSIKKAPIKNELIYSPLKLGYRVVFNPSYLSKICYSLSVLDLIKALKDSPLFDAWDWSLAFSLVVTLSLTTSVFVFGLGIDFKVSFFLVSIQAPYLTFPFHSCDNTWALF